ncbi:hypothetical protein ACHAXA_002424 [Cyclostephanos tholiformis]|uniref:Uncharacterized protein n=1 Tax=Cyclostephanos tholiformis TaxID=382380 RepID=A0ABD3S015_9STRA
MKKGGQAVVAIEDGAALADDDACPPTRDDGTSLADDEEELEKNDMPIARSSASLATDVPAKERDADDERTSVLNLGMNIPSYGGAGGGGSGGTATGVVEVVGGSSSSSTSFGEVLDVAGGGDIAPNVLPRRRKRLLLLGVAALMVILVAVATAVGMLLFNVESYASEDEEGEGDAPPEEGVGVGDNVRAGDDTLFADDDEFLVGGDDVVASDDGMLLDDDDMVASDDFTNNDDVRSEYPKWSWDRVRTYVAIRRGDDYSDDQILALGAQDIVMLEKYNGHETHGSTEMGTLVAARRIKAANATVKVLFYLNCMVHYGGYEANVNFKDEWALLNPKMNNATFKWRDRLLSYDHTNSEFQEWWVQRALDMLAHDEIDGIFIDGICKVESVSLQRIKGDAWVEQHGAAYRATAKQLRERLPPGKIMIGNALRARAGTDGNYRNLQHLDGSYLENWSDQQNLVTSMQLMTKALKAGKLIMLNGDMSHTDFEGIDSLDARYQLLNQSEYIDFFLGYFLLVVEPHAYFSYHAGVDAEPTMLTVFDNNRFEAITRKLGMPLGDYIDDGHGFFSREFEHLKVHVNITSQQGTLSVINRPTFTSSSTGSPSSAPMSSMINVTSSIVPTLSPTCLASGSLGRLYPYVCPCLALGCVTAEPRCCSNKCRVTMKNVSFCIY